MSDAKYLPTVEAAEALKEMGLSLAPATLKKLRCVGGGPVFQHYGRKPVYTVPRLREYALSRLSAERTSTSGEPPARRRRA